MVEEKKSEVSFAELMRKAEEAKKNKAYRESIELFGIAREFAESSMSLKDSVPFIVARQALCTYKSKEPNEKTALLNAMEMLEELQPDNTNDVEILGLCGAIHKRLFEITNDPLHLESAISFYEKGFRVKQDYYNGINTAFMLYKKAMLQKQTGGEWEDTRIQADYLRNSVLQICRAMETEDHFSDKDDALWILLTIAEAWHYKGDAHKQREYEEKARNMAEIRKDTFAMTSYEEQSIKIDKIMDHLK